MNVTLSRTVLFVVTAFVVAIFYAPLGHDDYLGTWADGTYGIVNAGGSSPVIAAVLPGSSAERAGVRRGDVLLAKPFTREFMDVASPVAGDSGTFAFRRPGGSVFQASLHATATPQFTMWRRLTGVLAILPATVFLVVAFLLVFLRPGVMSWCFYVFAVGYFSTAPSFQYFHLLLREALYIAFTGVLSTIFGSFAVMPLIPFLLRFPDDRIEGWRRPADRIAWCAIAIAFVLYVLDWYSQLSTGSTLPHSELLDTFLPLAAFVAAAFILLKKIETSSPQLRERLRFLSIGVFVSFVAYAVYFVPGISFAVKQLVGYLVVLMPVTIAYAVFRHRVIDVNFVLNRALGYAILSILVIALVSLLDYAFSSLVSRQHFAVVAELVVTISVGLLLDRINKWIWTLLEATLFRHRRIAEEHLRRAADALPYATDESAVSDGLTQIPSDALKLTAAALYRRAFDGLRFEGVATSSETAMAPAGFERNHLLVRMLQSGERAIWLDEVRQYLDPENAAVYVIAIPVVVRHELVAFTLYGAHRNGAQIDPQELQLLNELAREASRAYDHVEAVRTRERYGRAVPNPLGEIA